MVIIFILLMYLAAHIFLSRQLAKILIVKTRIRKITFYLAYFFIALSYLWSRKLPAFVPGQVGDTIALVGGFVIANTYYSVLLILIYKLILKIYWYFTRKTFTIASKNLLLVLLSLLVLINSYGIHNAKRQILKEYVITTNKELKTKELKIVMLSDTHFGKTTSEDFSRHLVEKINCLKPDLVLLVGDIIDSDIESVQRKKLLSPFKSVQARLGVYGVMGNHEYIGGNSQRVLQLLQNNNIRILIDEKIEIQEVGVVIFGLDDESREKYKEQDALATLKTLSAIDYNIVLDHQPKRIKKISEIKNIDLLLSGHTHRGQYFPNNYITQKIYINDWGVKEINKLVSIVSSGYGNWSAPLRLGSEPELVIIKINKNK